MLPSQQHPQVPDFLNGLQAAYGIGLPSFVKIGERNAPGNVLSDVNFSLLKKTKAAMITRDIFKEVNTGEEETIDGDAVIIEAFSCISPAVLKSFSTAAHNKWKTVIRRKSFEPFTKKDSGPITKEGLDTLTESLARDSKVKASKGNYLSQMKEYLSAAGKWSENLQSYYNQCLSSLQRLEPPKEQEPPLGWMHFKRADEELHADPNLMFSMVVKGIHYKALLRNWLRWVLWSGCYELYLRPSEWKTMQRKEHKKKKGKKQVEVVIKSYKHSNSRAGKKRGIFCADLHCNCHWTKNFCNIVACCPICSPRPSKIAFEQWDTEIHREIFKFIIISLKLKEVEISGADRYLKEMCLYSIRIGAACSAAITGQSIAKMQDIGRWDRVDTVMGYCNQTMACDPFAGSTPKKWFTTLTKQS